MPGTTPAPDNDYLLAHAELLLSSYRLRTGRALVAADTSLPDAARHLYFAPFALLSHDSADDPLFTYANLTAQVCFEMRWEEIVGLPSRMSAESMARPAREKLLRQVAGDGYIDGYSGVRIAKSGRRFLIGAATVWNLSNRDGQLCGQAAMFSRWQDVVDPMSA